jgi:hypothetical protein
VTSTTDVAAHGCRELCHAAGEPLAGSAGSATHWVGIAWPKPLWDRDEVAESRGLPREIRTLARTAADAGHKLALRLFQRAPQPDTRAVELILFHGGQLEVARAVPLGDVAERVRALLRGERSPAASPPAPQILVCTDGRHDRCCALHGRPLLLALRHAAERRGAHVEIAESSHLGGHRFAGTCLTLPTGTLLGRVPPAAAGALLDTIERGVAPIEHVRGQIGQPELVQIAEAWARARVAGDVSLHIEHPEPTAPERVRVAVRASDGRTFELLCARRVFAPGATLASPCGELSPQTRWVVESGRER